MTTEAIVRADSAASAAAVLQGNPLEGGWNEIAPAAAKVVGWSGWVGEGDPPHDIFPKDPRTWGPAAWSGLASACERLLPTLTQRRAELCLRPHARHVLSDPQRCLAFLKGREDQPIRLLLEPAAFLTGGMLAAAADHLERAFSALGGHPSTWAVLLTNRARVNDHDDDLLGPAPLHDGLLDPALLADLCERHVPAAVPRVILAREAAAQAAVLGA